MVNFNVTYILPHTKKSVVKKAKQKKYEQPKHPSADEWINKNVVYPYSGILFGHENE